MILKRLTYILLPLLPLALTTGCSDDIDLPGQQQGGWGNTDVVTFTAQVGHGASPAGSRAADGGDGEEKLYDPLELTNPDEAGDFTLYLHTYDSHRIGFQPGDQAAEADTAATSRGMQIESIEQLKEHHKDFMALARYTADGTTDYIPWCNARESSVDNIWLPDRTYYWPSQQELNFYAIAPSSQFAKVEQLKTIEPGTISFKYTARKSDKANHDAEAQEDLMMAASSCDKAGSVDGHAPLQFHHALSAVKFAVRDVLDGEVVNIKIKGIYGSGECIYKADADGSNGTFTWSNLTDKDTEYSQDFGYKLTDRPIVDPSDDSHDLVLNNAMPQKTFMVIPQVLKESGARIEITLKRTNPGVDENNKPLPEQITVSAPIDQNEIEEWLPGHEYVYTISTSKDNWVTIFQAYGNHIEGTTKHSLDGSLDGNQIYIYSPSVNEHDTYGDSAYFKVLSYRYRANDMSHVEPLKWTATHGPGKQYRNGSYIGIENDVEPDVWIRDKQGKKGPGNSNWEFHPLGFEQHHVRTDWPGDSTMRRHEPYTGNSMEEPWDLSTCGGRNKKGRYTANCYVVDREGWYTFPLVYGNGIAAGGINSQAYKGGDFVNHNGWTIPADNPYINPAYHGSAGVVWADVYNAVTDVELINAGSKDAMIRFKVNRGNIQQGNVIIALYDKANQSGTVAWSWHIWINEHWLDPDPDTGGLPHVFNTNGSAFEFEAAQKSGWRQRGDVKLNNAHVSGSYNYYLAPYNLGWCDPKNLDYLRRKSELKVVQYINGEPKNTIVIPILQEGEHIEYKYGNNTYYQWGRKDAIVGFVDHNSQVKRNFGPKQYEVLPQNVAMKIAHQNPQALFCKGTSDFEKDNKGNIAYLINGAKQFLPYDPNRDPATEYNVDNWLSSNPQNLWDNDGNVGEDNTSSIKTIYDPCPPGYKVPPTYALRFIGMSNKYTHKCPSTKKNTTHEPGYKNSESENRIPLSNLNGVQAKDKNGGTDYFTFIISSENFTYSNGVTEKSIPDANKIWLTSTGNRWYTDNRYNALKVKGGDNFNARIAYIWGSTPHSGGKMGLGIALGIDVNDDQLSQEDAAARNYGYCITSYFNGRKSMARTVRAIRE